MRRMLPHALLLVVLSGAATPCFSQTNPNLQTYFKDYIGLSEDQIAAVRGGQAVAKTLHSRTPEEIFVFGAVYVNATPDSYLKFSRDFERLRKLPGYLALSEISSPPQLSDLKGFTFERGDIKDTETGKVPANLPCVGGLDDMSYDAAHKRIYVTGDGTTSVFQQRDADHYEHIAEIPTGFQGKTSLFVPELNRLYVELSGKAKPEAKLALMIFLAQP